MYVYEIDKFAGKPALHPIAYHIADRVRADNFAVDVSDLWRDLKQRLSAYQQRRIDRKAFQNLLSMDDALLDDIGVTCRDVMWANSLPLCQNAAAQLENIARSKKSK